MRSSLATILAVILAAFPTCAQPQPLTDAQIRVAVSGKKIYFGNDGFNRYKPDGTFEFHTSDGRILKGTYSVSDGKICHQFTVSGRSRCDRIVKDGEKVLLVDGKGTKYPLVAN